MYYKYNQHRHKTANWSVNFCLSALRLFIQTRPTQYNCLHSLPYVAHASRVRFLYRVIIPIYFVFGHLAGTRLGLVDVIYCYNVIGARWENTLTVWHDLMFCKFFFYFNILCIFCECLNIFNYRQKTGI